MEFIGNLFIAKPLRAAVVAAVFLALYLLRRFMASGTGHASPWPLVAANAWAAYAAWEWAILLKTPDANIRVDLLVIYPVLAVLSAWALYRAIR